MLISKRNEEKRKLRKAKIQSVIDFGFETDRDELTGAMIRSDFERDLSQLDSMTEKEKLNIGIMIMDANHLAHLNEISGREKGDLAIQLMYESAKVIINSSRKCYRTEDDEFIIISLDGKISKDEMFAIREAFNKMAMDRNFRLGIGIASGVFDPFLDLSLKNTESRVRKRLYANKIQMDERE